MPIIHNTRIFSPADTNPSNQFQSWEGCLVQSGGKPPFPTLKLIRCAVTIDLIHMRTQILKRHLGTFGIGIILIGILIVILIATAPEAPGSQRDTSSLVRLFRLDGTFSEELPANLRPDDNFKNPGFSLTGARLEADNAGAFTRLRALLTISNGDPGRRITDIEWRVDIYDASLRTVSARVLQADKVNIYPGETAVASAKLGAVLPDRMIVLLQISKVSFVDGPAWVAAQECSLGQDLRSVTCKTK